MTARALKQAVLARLREPSVMANVVYEGAVPAVAGRQWYVVVYTNTGLREIPRFTGNSSQITQTFTIHSVGLTPDQAQLTADRVMTQLLDFRPNVSGWNTRRMTHEVSRPTEVDRDPTPPLFYNVDEFDLVAVATG